MYPDDKKKFEAEVLLFSGKKLEQTTTTGGSTPPPTQQDSPHPRNFNNPPNPRFTGTA